MGEPITAFYEYAANSIVLITKEIELGREHASGQMLLGMEVQNMPEVLKGEVLEIRASSGKKLYSTEPRAWCKTRIEGRWIRLSSLPAVGNASPLQRHLSEVGPSLAPRFTQSVGKWFVDVVGVVGREEVQQDQFGDGWVFLVRMKQAHTQEQRSVLVRAGRAGFTDFTARAPTLAFLRQKNVSVVGLGSVGSPIAIELARCGLARLSLIDFDFVEPGSTVRWPLGMEAAGLQKTRALKGFISKNYPFTKVSSVDYRFGMDPFDAENALEAALSAADAIVDATAEQGVHQFLADYCRANRKPFVFSYLTPGGYGGLVARFDPSKEMGCWRCLQCALYEEKSIPEPPAQENGELQPPGCGERTAMFAGFDSVEVSLETVRTVVSLLGGGADGGYPAADWDVGVLALRSPSGGRTPPRWNAYRLPRNPRCSC